jgi:serine phosphatase RsbU (regulator of sigma subunit)
MGEPAAMAHWLNDRFRYFDRLRYFTFLYGILDFQQLTFRYTSAAHPGPIVISRGRARHCHLTPPAVGFQEDARFRNRTLHLHPGDRIYLYNTGFFGPRNALGESFTEDVLTDLLLAESQLPIEEGVNRAGVRVLEWDPSGHLRRDLCLVGVEINNGNAPA